LAQNQAQQLTDTVELFSSTNSPLKLRTTATISQQDVPVFITDSLPTWRSPTPSSLPVRPVPRDFQQAPQHDFVLYDHPKPRGRPNCPNLASPSLGRGQRDNFNSHQARVNPGIGNTIPSFSSGPSPTPDRLSARGSSSQRPSRSVSRRPPVPYFTHRTGSLPQSPVRMDIRGMLDTTQTQGSVASRV